MRYYRRLVIMLPCLLAGATLLRAQDGTGRALLLDQAVRTHRFEITLAPRDAASRDVRTADLFMSRSPGSAWRYIGPCRVMNTEREKLFVRWVRVPADGTYYFRTRAGDDAGKDQLPLPADQPDARVVVDSVRPSLRLENPLGGEECTPGRVVTIRWRAQDSNFGERPIRIDYSTDRGRTWKVISASAANDGREDWLVPPTSARALLIRVSARDRAGNLAAVVTERPLRIVPAPAAGKENGEKKAGDPPPPPPPARPAKKQAVPPERKAPSDAAVGGGRGGEKPVARGGKKFPWLDANDANLTRIDWNKYTPDYDAYTNYIIAGNLARQGRTKDALRYYNAAVTRDEKFCDAWNDLAQVYRELGAYGKALRCIDKALELQPHNPMYNHTAGEVYQARSFHLLRTALGDEDLTRAVQANSLALKYYNHAIQAAQKQGRLAECGATYFRLGEICYYVNRDPVGARMYWQKVISLHTPKPNLDDVILRAGTSAEAKARETREHYTRMWVELATWQRWARACLAQLDAMERAGKLQPAPRAARAHAPAGFREAPPALPAAAARGRAAPGKGDYLVPGYGSKPEPGDVQRDIPAPAPRAAGRRSHARARDARSRDGFTPYPRRFRAGAARNRDAAGDRGGVDATDTCRFWKYERR